MHEPSAERADVGHCRAQREGGKEGCKGEWQMSALYYTYERAMPACDLPSKGFAMLMQVHSSLLAELICAAHWTFTFKVNIEQRHKRTVGVCVCVSQPVHISMCLLHTAHVCVFWSYSTVASVLS